MAMRNYKAKDVDSYIMSSLQEAQPKLEELRKLIKSAIPKAQEGISWGVPWYKNVSPIVGFAAYKNHVGLVFWLDELRPADRKKLLEKGYKTGKRTLQIKFDQKVPTTAIKHILKAQAKINVAKRAIK